MPSRQAQLQKDTHYRPMQLLQDKPTMSQRAMAKQDCITVLLLGPVEKGGLPAEMVAAGLAQAKQHALLKTNCYSVNVSIE